jgi:CubicO group peptidase (beta-lactamase class C family)
MSKSRKVSHARIWLAAGLASVVGTILASCAMMPGAGESAAAKWPTQADVAPVPTFTADGLAALDAKMKEAVDKGQVSGVEYVLFKDGKVADFKAFGTQSLGGPPMSENTIFRVRSMSKPITGVAMMQLYEKGLWKPDDPISKFLPELAHLKVAPNGGNDVDHLVDADHVPTMRELFTHTAGFGYGLSAATAVDRMFIDRSPMGEKDMAAMLKRVAEIPLLAQPGTRWSYSIGIDVQGAIVEKLSGMSFGNYLEKNIFKPLGMNDTGFWLTEKERPRLATVYQRNNETGNLGVFPDPDNRSFFKADHEESGGGGLASTTHDYARFVQMLLNKGTLEGHQILKPETVDMMFQNQAPAGINPPRLWGFGGSISGPTSERSPQPPGTFSWFGIDGTWFWADGANKLGFVGMIQRRGNGGPGGVNFQGDSASAIYKALVK